MGAKIALISSNDKDGIAELADVVVTVGAQTKDKSDSGSSIQPMGTLFEPVSYTHLDVYKRQADFFDKRIEEVFIHERKDDKHEKE